MIVDSLGVRPSSNKIDAVTQLNKASTVEEMRALLGTSEYLRKFGPNYRALVAPISNLLRDKRFSSKCPSRMKRNGENSKTKR